MRFVRLALALALSLALGPLAAGRARACACDAPFDPAPDFARADLVVEGFTMENPSVPSEPLAPSRFVVRRVFKGPNPALPYLDLAPPIPGAACQARPSPGRLTLLFARTRPDGTHEPIPCGPTRVSVAWLHEALERLSTSAGLPGETLRDPPSRPSPAVR